MYGATVFPHNIGLGATRDPALVREVEHVTAEETRATGPQWAFAPCICVARDDRWGRTYESFGEDPALVTRMETAIDGFQGAPGPPRRDPDRVLATAKHFAGDGDTTYGTGQRATGNYPIDQGVDQVRPRHVRPARAVARTCRPCSSTTSARVMPSYSDVDCTEDGLGNPINMHANRDLITGWLKDKIGFDGFVITDYNGIDHIDPGDRPTFADAGRRGRQRRHRHVHAAARTSSSFETDADRRSSTPVRSRWRGSTTPCSRILTKKFELGLFEHPYTDRRNIDQVGSPAHRAVARRPPRSRRCCSRTPAHALPLRGQRDVYVAGRNADNIGNQAGGWTLTWQGGSTNVDPRHDDPDGHPPGRRRQRHLQRRTPRRRSRQRRRRRRRRRDAVLRGLRRRRRPAVGVRPRRQRRARPVKDMQLSAADKAAVDKVCAAAKCVVLVVSGRPLIIDPAQLQRDRRPRRVLAARQRGRGRGRHAVRRTAVHRQAAR